MIKNIIFDLSGVVLKYDIKKYLTSIGIDVKDQDTYKKIIWSSKEWNDSDAGKITYEEIVESLSSRYPEYNKIRYILENKNNDILLSDNKETINYIQELKERGFKIYFLSNINKWDIEYNINRFDFFKFADGAIYSCDVKYVKPEKECYLALINKYNLKVEECIFIDDTKINIDSARELGIKSILFDDLENVKKQVDKIINKK